MVAACATLPAQPAPATLTPLSPESTATPARPTPSPALATLPPENQPVPVQTGIQELPPQSLLEAIIADLALRAGVSAEAIAVVSSEAIVWNDGSLGCPQPDVVYTQALVPGYQIILEAGGQKFDYHTSERNFVLCEN